MRNSMVCIIVGLIAGNSSGADFTPIAGWDRQLFPSFILGTAAVKAEPVESDDTRLGDAHGLLGISITAVSDDLPIDVSVECKEFLEPSRWSGTLPAKGTTYNIYPKIKYKFDRLSQCSQATPATITFRVQVGKSNQEEVTETVTFRSINDCPINFSDNDYTIDTSFTFATFVNEQHPYVDKLLREALDIGVVDSFTGYQSGTEEEVYRQVYALWDLLVARDVRYSSITTTAADSNNILSQHVRLLEDTINNQQANCVDGSVLMVSLLKKIGIESYLVLVPGHCYIGFYLDPSLTKTVGLETTLIGVEVDSPDETDVTLEQAVQEELRSDQSWASFAKALAIGTEELAKCSKELSNPEQSEYRIIDIAAARKLGVLPIPYRSSEIFVAVDHSAYISGDTDAHDDDEEDDEEDEEDDEE